MFRRQGPWLALIVLVGLLLRLTAALALSDSMLRMPEADPDAYVQIAKEWNRTGVFSLDENQPTAYRPPGYVTLLASILMLGQEHLAPLVFAIHLLLSSVTIFLTYSLSMRLGLERASLLSAALVAVDPILVRQSTLFMTETLYTALLTGSLLGFLRLEPKRWITSGSIVVGILTGLASLTRPIAWPAWCLLGLVSLICHRWRAWIVASAIALLICLPWGLRNQSQLGQLTLTTTHGGYTLWLGQNPVYYKEVVEAGRPTWEGESFERWVLENQTLAVGMTETERDDAFRRRAIDWMREHPREAARSMLHHLGSFWRPWPHTGPEKLRPWIALFYSVLFLFALMGFATPRAWIWPGIALVSLPISFSVVHALYWSDMRMRAPLVPVIACLAVMGITRWILRRLS